MTSVLVCALGSLVLNSLHYGHTEEAQRAVVTLQPNWPKIYREEKVTLRCAIENGGDAEWEYSWRTNSSITPAREQEYSITAYMFHGGHYRCRGRNVARKESRTKWSDPVKLTVCGYLPKPVLSASPSWLDPGASVTLNCGVEHPAAGWSFYWYRAVPDLSHGPGSYRSLLLPGSANGTAGPSFVVPGQTRTAQFTCRAARGDFYTHFSEPVLVWSRESDAAASLTVSPAGARHFSPEPVSLRCEGNASAWRVMRLTEAGPSRCHGWGIMAGSTCTVHGLQYGDAVYWCESGSGDFSNAVNVTVLPPRPDGSPGIVALLAGLLSAALLLLLFLARRLATRGDPCGNRSAPVNLDKSEEHVYSFLRQGDACVYDSLRGAGAAGNRTGQALLTRPEAARGQPAPEVLSFPGAQAEEVRVHGVRSETGGRGRRSGSEEQTSAA